MEAKYINKKEVMGLKRNHTYVVYFSKPPKSYVYDARILYDKTSDEEMDLYLNYSSQISIKQSFDIKEVILDEL